MQKEALEQEELAYEEELKTVSSLNFFEYIFSYFWKNDKNFTQEITNNIPGMEIREEEEDEGIFFEFYRFKRLG